MNRRAFLAGSVGATTIGLAGCTSDGEPAVDPDDIVTTIVANEQQFDPIKTHVEVGEAVEWVNETDSEWEVHSNDNLNTTTDWDLRRSLAPGERTAYLFEESGVYSYHDSFYTMFIACGAVAVGDSTVDDIPTLGCEEGIQS